MTVMPAPPPSLDRFIRLAKIMEWVTAIGIVLITVLAVAAVVYADWTRNLALAKLGQAGMTIRITPIGQALAAIVVAIPLAVMLVGLFAVKRMFSDFAHGDILTARAAGHLRTFAATILLQAPLSPLVSAGLSAALTFGDPSGRKAIMIGLSLNDYFALVIGGVLLATATIMREAARVAEENASFV